MDQRSEINYDRPDDILDRLNNNVYQCVSYLTKGGFGKIYKIKRIHCGIRSQREFCGKFIRNRSDSDSDILNDEINNEITLQHRLKHKNVLRLIAWVDNRDYKCLISDYCNGYTMEELLQRRRSLTEPEIRFFSLQMVDGLEYLKNNMIIHRDIKPANVLLTGRMIVKIADFGLAIEVPASRNTVKKTNTCGTVPYMSPEMLDKNVTTYNFKVDVWAFGCMLYCMFKASPPFCGLKPDDIFINILSGKYVIPADMSNALANLIKQILQVPARERPGYYKIRRHSFFRDGFTPKHLDRANLVAAPAFVERTHVGILVPASNYGVVLTSSERSKNAHTKQRQCLRYCCLNMLHELLTDIVSKQRKLLEWNESELLSPNSEPLAWVEKYRTIRILSSTINKYLAYQLNTEVAGGFYSDRTSISLPYNGAYVQYSSLSESSKNYIWKRSHCPSVLTDRIDHLSTVYGKKNNPNKRIKDRPGEYVNGTPYVVYFKDYYDRMLFVLSTGLVQITVKVDDSKIFVCPRLRSFTVRQNSYSFTYGLSKLYAQGYPIELDRSLRCLVACLGELLDTDPCFSCNKSISICNTTTPLE